eukprot:ANDGO_02141.mRNA.1 putative serine/threonine-protein kinase DDB_G0292354
MLAPSTVLGERYRVGKKLGVGAFGEAYVGTDLVTSSEIAIKIERNDTRRMVLRLEIAALKRLLHCPRIVRYIASGRSDDLSYLIMTRQGENLAELRKQTPAQRFAFRTVLWIAPQMVESIQQVHSAGYLHRDIKPANFVVGISNSRDVYLIDFGLARKFRTQTGEMRPARPSAGFRGTARYASLASHRGEELSRRDDLWSLLYVLVEMCVGHLPWRKVKDKEAIGKVKEAIPHSDFCANLPLCFSLFYQHLVSLRYEDEPDYAYIRELFLKEDLGEKSRLGLSEPDLPVLDWESGIDAGRDRFRYVPLAFDGIWSAYDNQVFIDAILHSTGLSQNGLATPTAGHGGSAHVPHSAPHPPLEPRSGADTPLRKTLLKHKKTNSHGQTRSVDDGGHGLYVYPDQRRASTSSLPQADQAMMGETAEADDRAEVGCESDQGLRPGDDDDDENRVYASVLQRTSSLPSSSLYSPSALGIDRGARYRQVTSSREEDFDDVNNEVLVNNTRTGAGAGTGAGTGTGAGAGAGTGTGASAGASSGRRSLSASSAQADIVTPGHPTEDLKPDTHSDPDPPPKKGCKCIIM